jgi:hypothetical protein
LGPKNCTYLDRYSHEFVITVITITKFGIQKTKQHITVLSYVPKKLASRLQKNTFFFLFWLLLFIFSSSLSTSLIIPFTDVHLSLLISDFWIALVFPSLSSSTTTTVATTTTTTEQQQKGFQFVSLRLLVLVLMAIAKVPARTQKKFKGNKTFGFNFIWKLEPR